MKTDISEKLKIVERHARVGSPLMQLFNERWASVRSDDQGYREATVRVQAISQEILNLITKGLL
ncbi:hypothetical protein [Treponema primitia]|uniref:hypothetical protein n=1 Tax=Treponema primitia TaxID=88058 RepID=UPI0002554E5C|nr:hypothetical protein [Treponema primitia]